jgi:hypothetical protein
MSISLKVISGKFYFVAVPLLFAAGVTLALYFSLSGYFDQEDQRRIDIPFFAGLDFEKETGRTRQPWYWQRDIFSSATVAPEQNTTATEQDLEAELNEIVLAMTIVKGAKRFCLTNGILLGEGEGGRGFMVIRIEPDGVWYRVGGREVWLKTGDKIYLNVRYAKAQINKSGEREDNDNRL